MITKALSGFYYVDVQGCPQTNGGRSSGGQLSDSPPVGVHRYKCRARGIFKKESLSPLVGDEVIIDILDEEDGFVTEIMERRNSFIRPAVANIDVFVATVSVSDPAPHPEVLDRFLITAEAAHAGAIICVNKSDLGSAEDLMKIYAHIYEVLPVSAVTGDGIEKLKSMLAGKKSAFAGPSGVGKSSIINRLLDENIAETGVISGKTRRGKHTTRHVEIYGTGFGAGLFDTPGYTSFESTPVEERELGELFPEFSKFRNKCKFDDCLHTVEPGCSVRTAKEAGKISASRYASYLHLLDEIMEKKKRERY